MKQLDLAPLWKALADPKRRRIIQLLQEKPRTTSEISAHFDVSRFAIMRHLKVLEQAALIKTRREGRQRWNNLNEDLFREIQRTYLDHEVDDGYQLGDILSFLAREEGGQGRSAVASEPRSIQLEVELPAAVDRVFRALTDEIDYWWSYRIGADSTMILEPQVGGRFFESFSAGGGALYAIVTYLKPGQEIRLDGSMGLAQEGPNNVVHIALQSLTPETTRVTLTHRFVDQVGALTVDTFKRSWVELLAQHLKTFVQSGIRYQVPF